MKAAIITGSTERGKLTQIQEAPVPSITDEQILVKTVAVAINPTDWKHVVGGWGIKGATCGTDASGIIVKVGPKVKGFEVGDIVSTFIHGSFKKGRGAFAEYAIAIPQMTIKYPKDQIKNDALQTKVYPIGKIDTFEGAASVTLGLTTVSLAYSNSLKIPVDKALNAKKHILIWGGSTATGFLAVQVAKLALGLQVITTASESFQEELKAIGADYVFDYKDPNVVGKIQSTIGGIEYALDTVSEPETFQQTYDATAGASETAIDNLLFLDPSILKLDSSRNVKFATTLAYDVEGVDMKLADMEIKIPKGLVEDYSRFWYDVLPPYISQIKHIRLKVLEKGLESTNEGLELSRDGKVHREKLVYRI